MKQKLTLANIIMIIAELVLMFIPGVFGRQFWAGEQDAYYFMSGEYGTYSLTHTTGVNILKTYTTLNSIIAIVVIVLLIASALGFIIMYIKNDKKSQWALLSPIVSLLAFVVLTVCVLGGNTCDGTDSYLQFVLGWLYYVILGLHILTIVFSALIKFKFSDEKTEK